MTPDYSRIAVELFMERVAVPPPPAAATRPSLLQAVRRLPCDPAPGEVEFHEACHLLAAVRLGVPTTSASVNAAGGLVLIDPRFIRDMKGDPAAIAALAAVQAAGAVGTLFHCTDPTATDPTPYLSEQDARNLGTLKAEWEAARPGEPWPCPFTAAARVLADHPVHLAAYPLAKMLGRLGEVTPDNARTLLADVEAEIAAAGRR